jgi:hypothetical protein
MARTEFSPQRCAQYWFKPNQHVLNWCGHQQEFITMPDTAGMWWLVPIIVEAS